MKEIHQNAPSSFLCLDDAMMNCLIICSHLFVII